MDNLHEETQLLRADPHPLFERLRTLLRARGIDPFTALLAELFTDDNSLEFGIVVASDGRVFQFDYDYLGRDVGNGDFSQWNDLTSDWREATHHEQIRVALEQQRSKDQR